MVEVPAAARCWLSRGAARVAAAPVRTRLICNQAPSDAASQHQASLHAPWHADVVLGQSATWPCKVLVAGGQAAACHLWHCWGPGQQGAGRRLGGGVIEQPLLCLWPALPAVLHCPACSWPDGRDWGWMQPWWQLSTSAFQARPTSEPASFSAPASTFLPPDLPPAAQTPAPGPSLLLCNHASPQAGPA